MSNYTFQRQLPTTDELRQWFYDKFHQSKLYKNNKDFAAELDNMIASAPLEKDDYNDQAGYSLALQAKISQLFKKYTGRELLEGQSIQDYDSKLPDETQPDETQPSDNATPLNSNVINGVKQPF